MGVLTALPFLFAGELARRVLRQSICTSPSGAGSKRFDLAQFLQRGNGLEAQVRPALPENFQEALHRVSFQAHLY